MIRISRNGGLDIEINIGPLELVYGSSSRCGHTNLDIYKNIKIDGRWSVSLGV